MLIGWIKKMSKTLKTTNFKKIGLKEPFNSCVHDKIQKALVVDKAQGLLLLLVDAADFVQVMQVGCFRQTVKTVNK